MFGGVSSLVENYGRAKRSVRHTGLWSTSRGLVRRSWKAWLSGRESGDQVSWNCRREIQDGNSTLGLDIDGVEGVPVLKPTQFEMNWFRDPMVY